MARTMSVKIPVSSLIADIEASIAKIDEAVENYATDRKNYETEMTAYKENVAKFVSGFISKNASNIGYDYDSQIRINHAYNGKVELILDKDTIDGFPDRPEEPVKPNQKEWFGREHQTRKQILERNLKVLRMTTQEEVSASSYSSVMELI
jgi:hypothetical protein